MSKRRFSKKQIDGLLMNSNVAKCSEKSITYAKDFKIWAVRQYEEEGKMASEIFKEAGFDLQLIGKYTPKSCLRDWRRIFKLKGVDGFNKEMRGRGKGGGRPKTKGIADTDKIKRLEAKVAYLNAENDFLAKLRGLKRE